MRNIFALAIGVLLSGCAGSHMVYPETWAPLTTAEKSRVCPSIAGTYRVVSEPLYQSNRTCTNVGKGWYCRSLLEDFIGVRKTVPKDTWVQVAEIDGTELKITVGINNTIQESVTLRAAEKQFECREDGVVVKIGSEFMAGDGAIGINTGFEKIFRKASDGSLVMKETTAGGGLIFLVIPVAGSSTQWWKWKPVER